MEQGRPFNGLVFESFKDPKIFKKFFIEAGTLAWRNGVDLAPEALYAVNHPQKGITKGWRERERRVVHPKG